MATKTDIPPEFIETSRLAAAAGLSHARIAQLHGVNERTLYRLKNREPALASALAEGAEVNAQRCRCCGQIIKHNGDQNDG